MAMSGNGESMGIEYQIGDATRPTGDRPKIIVHVCNDAGGWGKGFVAALSRRWREPERYYRAWHHCKEAQPFALGQVQFVQVEGAVWVANLIGQHGIGFQNGLPPIRYEAIRAGLHVVAMKAKELGADVHMPRMGSGLAGGKWNEIERIIGEELIVRGVAVTVYDLPQRQIAVPFRHTSSAGQTPPVEHIQIAIGVLKKLADRIDNAAASSVDQMPDSKWADKFAERLEARTIEQTTSIKSIMAKLQNWHNELSQQPKQSISCRI